MDRYMLKSVMVIWLMCSILIMGTYAYFSDTETARDNTMTAGVLNLKVNDGPDPYIGTLVHILDLKPEYTSYSSSIDLVINDNPGKVYKRISNLQCDQQELGNDLASMTWFDLSVDGEQIISTGEKTFRNIVGQWIYLGTFGPDYKIPVIQSFTLQDCLFEWSELEQCTFDEEFAVEQINAPSPEGCYNPAGGSCPGGVEMP